MAAGSFPTSDRSRVRRKPDRATAERATVNRILDAGLVCHVGIVVEGRPVVIPMAYGRDGDRLILHGATSSRLMRALAGGCEACVNVMLLDGLVVAHSAFDSSMNYRSVVAFGHARRITRAAEKRSALDVLTDHLLPGRTAEVRPPTENELAATEVIELLIEEATAKVRSGPPSEPAQPIPGDVWTGVVPLHLTAGAPEPAIGAPGAAMLPHSVLAILRRRL